MHMLKHFSASAGFFWAIVVVASLVSCVSDALANGVSGLDAESRRSVREAQMNRFGTREPRSPNGNQNPSGTVVHNSARGQKGACTTQVGQMTNYGTQHGTKVQQVTVVEGNVVNVCD